MTCDHNDENSGEMARHTIDDTGQGASVVTTPILD
jgi:hypothetical protein